MNEAGLRNEIQEDLREAPGDMVIYLEGETDPVCFFALLGLPLPSDGLFEWLAHAFSVGGLAEVREWWGRITGKPP